MNVAGTAALLYLLRARIGRLDGRAIVNSVVEDPRRERARRRGLLRGLASARRAGRRSFPGQVVSLGLALAASALAYFGACKVLRVREMQALLSLRGRLSRA